MKFEPAEPNVPFSFESALTCWDTWILTAMYYIEHFKIVKDVIESFCFDVVFSIKITQIYFKVPRIKRHLTFIKSNLEYLPNTLSGNTSSKTKFSIKMINLCYSKHLKQF